MVFFAGRSSQEFPSEGPPWPGLSRASLHRPPPPCLRGGSSAGPRGLIPRCGVTPCASRTEIHSGPQAIFPAMCLCLDASAGAASVAPGAHRALFGLQSFAQGRCSSCAERDQSKGCRPGSTGAPSTGSAVAPAGLGQFGSPEVRQVLEDVLSRGGRRWSHPGPADH